MLLDKHFPKAHKLSKVFNRNDVKVSYNSMPNFASIINSYNKKILNENFVKQMSAPCKYWVKASFPLDGNCLVYNCKAATQKTTNNYPHYIGLTENTFKDLKSQWQIWDTLQGVDSLGVYSSEEKF